MHWKVLRCSRAVTAMKWTKRVMFVRVFIKVVAFLPSLLPWPLWLLEQYLNSRTSALENRAMRYIRELCVRFYSFLEETLNYSYHTKGSAFK